MNFIAYLKKYTTLPKDFVKEYAKIFYSDEENDIERTMIDFDLVTDWLEISPKSLKRDLVKNYEKNIDYVIKSDSIFLSPNTVKHVALSCLTISGAMFRKLYLELEGLVYKYHKEIRKAIESRKKKEPETGGYMYILEGLSIHNNVNINSVIQYVKETQININKRNKTYKSNTQVNPIIIMKADDIMSFEKSIKKIVKNNSYQIYVFNIDLLEDILTECKLLIGNGRIETKTLYFGKFEKTGLHVDMRKLYIKFVKNTDSIKTR